METLATLSQDLPWEDSVCLQDGQLPNVQILLKNLEVSGMQLDERAEGTAGPVWAGLLL